MRMSKKYSVHQASEEQIPDIIRFIADNWNKEHIFVKSEDFFRYMLCDENGVNVIIAEDEAGVIYGMEGCTLYNSSSTPDSSGMMWKCLKTDDVMLGIEIDQYMQKYKNQNFHFGVGSNPNTTIKITKRFYKHKTGKMDHFYRLRKLDKYHLAEVAHFDFTECAYENKKLCEISSRQELECVLPDSVLKKYTPYKDIGYLCKRYLNHPIYKYILYYIVDDNEESNAVIIMRIVEANGARAIKIVDFIGEDNDISGLGYEFDRLMELYDCEYIDIYSVGISEDALNSSGMIRLNDGDSNIIPNYYEPFEQKNVDIYFTAPYTEGIKLFRGDADQDRPNFLKNEG